VSEEIYHVPVLREEVTKWLLGSEGNSTAAKNSEKVFVDATLGGGGHSEAILERSGTKVIGIDQDPDALGYAQKKLSRFQGRFIAVQANFREIVSILQRLSIQKIDGILFDLGVSSHQLEQKERGFSFQSDGPLDMRMNAADSLTARDIVNTYETQDLANLIFKYGEERHSRTLARAITYSRKIERIETTGDLARIITQVIKGHYPSRSVARVFQALRIVVNDELENLKRTLAAVPSILNSGGRIVVLAYHSLEDRIVKDFFRRESTDCICPPKTIPCVCGHQASLTRLTRKPVRAPEEEVSHNSRAASAKMRVSEKI
jgi:16S rRNA (cytosine1402-N4)-methyltransferase